MTHDISMSTRRGSVLLIALGLMTACVALAFAFLSASARTLGSAQDESAGLLSRSAVRQGTVHAMRCLIDDYVRHPHVPTNIRQAWWSGFRSIDSHRSGWDTAVQTDNHPNGLEGSPEDANGNDVPVDGQLTDMYFNDPSMRESGWSYGNWLHFGLGRWIEPGHFHTDLLNKPISFHLVHPVAASGSSPDPAVRAGENWLPDVDQPIYYDDTFAKVATRAQARYRLRYAVSIDDLNGHLLSNLVGPYQPPTNSAPSTVPTAADDQGIREVDATAVAQWGDSFNDLVLANGGEYGWWPLMQQFRGLGCTGDWANDHPRYYQRILARFSGGAPQVLDDWDRALVLPPAGEPTGRYDTYFPVYQTLTGVGQSVGGITGMRGPSYSWEGLKQARQEPDVGSQVYTPFGGTTTATPTPRNWNDSYLGCPWRVNLPTTSPMAFTLMLFGYLPKEPRMYRYQDKYEDTCTGRDGNTGGLIWGAPVTLGTNGSAGFFDAPSTTVNLFTSPSFASAFGWHATPYPGTAPTVVIPNWRIDLGKDINLSSAWLPTGQAAFSAMSPYPGMGSALYTHGSWQVTESVNPVIGGKQIRWTPGGANFFAIGPGNAYTYYDSYWFDLLIAFQHAYAVTALAWQDNTGAAWKGAPNAGHVIWPAVSGRAIFGTGTQLAIDTDADGDAVPETPGLADSPKDFDRLFLMALGEEPDDVARPTTPVTGIFSAAVGEDDHRLTTYTVNNNIRSLLISATPGVTITAGEAAEMELVLNDMRLSFLGASPQYPDFCGIDFDDNGIVRCSGYIGGQAVRVGAAYGPVVAADRRFSLTGYFVFQKSHFFRIFVRGEVFDELRQAPIASSDCESVVAIDPDGSLYDVNNNPTGNWKAVPANCAGLEDSGVIFQRWHRSLYQGAMASGTTSQ